MTGTNGKTTTVELLGAIHRAAGLPVEVAGNVGTPLASLVGELEPAATVVCEASSFQLEDTDAFAPECAVLLNVTEDHLDRHGTFEGYLAAKLRVFANQTGDDVAVLPSGFAGQQGRAATIRFGGSDADLAEREGELWWQGVRLMPASEIRLRGSAQPRERDGRRRRDAGARRAAGRRVRGAAHVRRRAAPPGGGGRA